MAILHLKSTNPDLSYILMKNPTSGAQLKKHKKGYLIGFYPLINDKLNESEYIIAFKDNPLECSYKEHEKAQFEYISNNQYNDARFINDAISEMLLSAREEKKTGEWDSNEFEHEMFISAVETNERALSLFQRHYKNIEISWEEISKNNFRVNFKTKSKLSYLLKFATVFSLFTSLEGNSNFIYIEDHLASKYVRLLNDIDAPYFIRYIFKISMLRSFNRFNEFKDVLGTDLMTFEFGDTHTQRMDFIAKLLLNSMPNGSKEYKYKNNILDIGAGYDFRYLKMIYPTIENSNVIYYAIERDEDAYEKINARIKTNGWRNVRLYKTYEEFQKDYTGEELNVICTEVLEHNEKQDAINLVRNLIVDLAYNMMIFTVPNKNFNEYYFEDENQFRHDDHKWEPTQIECEEFINDCVKELSVMKISKGLFGDTVRDINGNFATPSQYFIIHKN